MRLLKCVLVGGILVSAGQAYADDDATSEIRELKAKLKQLEQRVDDQGRKEKVIEAQAKALPAGSTSYKALPIDPCAAGKVCYKGITLTFGGWVDLTDIYRTRNLASDTGSVYNFIPFAQSKNFFMPESRFSARQTRFSVLAEGNINPETQGSGLRRNRLRRRGADRELGCDQLVQSAHAPAQPGDRSNRSRLSRPRRAILVAQCAEQGRHRSTRRRCARRDRFRNPFPASSPRANPASGSGRKLDRSSRSQRQPKIPQTSFFGGNTPTVGTPAVGPQGVLNPNLLVNLTGPGGSFFNNANNVSLNQVPDITVKGSWDPRLGPYHLHIEAWGLYRQMFDRFNFANHTYDTGSFGGHINAELIPKTLELQVYGAQGALGRFTATPFPDATLAQDGTILPLTITSAAVGLIWHTTPTLDLYSYAGLESAKAAFADVGTVPFGYGNPLYNNTGCNIENSPAATCNGNTHEVRQYTVGFYDTLFQGRYGDGQSRRAVFLQPALRLCGRRRRAEDRRQHRDDPAPLLSVQLTHRCQSRTIRIMLSPASPDAHAGGRSRARRNPGRSRRCRGGWRGCG